MIYSYKMLNRPGISSEIRQMFIKKHVFYCLTFIVVWTFVLINAYYELLTDKKFDDDEDETTLLMKSQGYEARWVQFPMGFMHRVWALEKEDKHYMDYKPLQMLSFIASIMTGLIMAIIRCLEPYFAFLLKKTFKSFYGIPLLQEELLDKKQLTDTITQFLNSSLNIELVHIILKGV